MNSRIKFALMLLSVVLLLCSCGSPKDIDTLPPAVESETEIGLSTERETEITAEETNNNTPPETDYEAELAIPDINLDEIVWLGVPYPAILGLTSTFIEPIPSEIDENKWYGVYTIWHSDYLYPMDPEETSYWIDGINEDGKLTALISDYNAKYNACMEFCKKIPINKLNEALGSEDYLTLRNQALQAKKEWKTYCENFFKETDTRLWNELESETDFSVRINLRHRIDSNQEKSKQINKAFFINNYYELRFRLLGLYSLDTILQRDPENSIFVIKGNDLINIRERLYSFDRVHVYWGYNPYAEE